MINLIKNNLQKLRILKLLILFSIVGQFSYAATVRVDVNNLRYTVDTSTQTAEVYGPVSSSTTITNLIIPDFIDYNGTHVPVISIRAFAFSRNDNLQGSLTIGDNVQTIGEYAFTLCSGFTGSLTIGNNVQTIGNSAFSNCSSFTGSLTIPNSVQTIGDYAFSNCYGFTGSLTIGDNVQTIGEGAFHGCKNFNGLIIGKTVETIGRLSFYSCSSMRGELRIPSSVREIGSSCFDATRFDILIIESQNLTLYYQTFEIMSLETITCYSINPPKCIYGSGTGGHYNDVFYGLYDIPLYVPAESVGAYKNAVEWEKFKYIHPISVEATAISLNKDELNLLIGDEETLNATLTPEDATTEVVWSVVDDNPIISIDQSGKVTALAVGEATVKATAGDVSATCKVTVSPVVASGVTLNVQDITLLVGQTDKLTATVTPENTTDKTITWKSDNEAVATVGTDGTVTAVSVGVANITATCGEATATCKVTVYGPEDITVKPGEGTSEGDEDDTPRNNTENGGSLVGNDLILRVNQTAAIYLVIPEGLSVEPEFVWSLDNGGAEIVSMTVAGNTLSATFKGLKVGNTGYTVSIVGVNGNIESVKGKITVIAEIPMTSLELDPASITMAQNALPQTIKPIYTPENASMPEFNWTSSVPTVATVDQDGKVSPVGQGQTIITATALDGSSLSATCEVTVTEPIDENFEFDFDESVMGGKEGISLYIGDTYQFTPKAQEGYVLPEVINWSSSDEKTVLVTEEGLVTALALGTSTITATATVNGKEVKAECKVTVIPVRAQSIKISAENLTLLVGQTDKLTATVTPENTTDQTITWKSDNEAVATVDTDGTVSAISVGVANITATCGEATATCKVTVNPILANSISIDGSDIHILKQTETLQLTATVIPDNTTYQDIIWKSSDESKATVSSSGLVTAIEVGDVEITATLSYQPQVTASYDITIQKRLLGDANDNGIVNVADVGTISDYIVEKPVYNFCFVNADVITDGKITTADVTATIDIIFNDTPSLAKFARARKISAVGSNELIVDNFNSGASSIVDVSLKNPSEFTGLQGSIIIPEGVTVRNVKKGAGASNHILNFNVTDRGSVEFILYSLQNATFDETGSLIELEIQAQRDCDDIIVENILASDSAANEYSLSFTGGKNNDFITSLDSVENANIKIYSSSGGIVILNAQGENVNIFNIAGERIISTKMISNKEFYPLTAGVYIVTVKTETAKLIVK